MTSTPVSSLSVGRVVECVTGGVLSSVAVIWALSAPMATSDTSLTAPAARYRCGVPYPMAAWRWASVRVRVTEVPVPVEDTVAPFSLLSLDSGPVPSRMCMLAGVTSAAAAFTISLNVITSTPVSSSSVGAVFGDISGGVLSAVSVISVLAVEAAMSLPE